MAYGGIAYVEAGDMHPFILEKLPLPDEQLWIAALYLHLVAAAISMPGCLALSSKWLLRRRWAHRWLGRVIALMILIGLVPSGAYLAFFATVHGTTSRIGAPFWLGISLP